LILDVLDENSRDRTGLHLDRSTFKTKHAVLNLVFCADIFSFRSNTSWAIVAVESTIKLNCETGQDAKARKKDKQKEECWTEKSSFSTTNLGSVVEHLRAGVQLQRSNRRDPRLLPPLVSRKLDGEHVVGEVLPKEQLGRVRFRVKLVRSRHLDFNVRILAIPTTQ
jgi:hypothetical protein